MDWLLLLRDRTNNSYPTDEVEGEKGVDGERGLGHEVERARFELGANGEVWETAKLLFGDLRLYSSGLLEYNPQLGREAEKKL